MPVGNEPGRWLLAVDTATDQSGAALFDGMRLAEASWPGGRQQTVGMLPAIEWLVDQAGLTMDDIGAVVVAIGPGSFTGLRVGLSLAKGLATASERAVIGVGTLDIIAAPYLASGVPCVAVAPAGRGRVVWSRHDGHGAATVPINAPFDDFLAQVADETGTVVAGELDLAQRELLTAAGVTVATPALSYRRPGVLAELGYSRWRQGEVDNAVTLEPVYLHGRPNPR